MRDLKERKKIDEHKMHVNKTDWKKPWCEIYPVKRELVGFWLPW